MNDIEILENFIDKQKSNKGTFVPTDFEIKSVENMIKENKELKEINNKLKKCDGILDVFNLGKESSRQRIQYDWVEKDKIKEIIYPTPENYISLEVQQSDMYKKLEKLVERE